MNSWKNKYSSSTKYTNVKTCCILQIDIEIYKYKYLLINMYVISFKIHITFKIPLFIYIFQDIKDILVFYI